MCIAPQAYGLVLALGYRGGPLGPPFFYPFFESVVCEVAVIENSLASSFQ